MQVATVQTPNLRDTKSSSCSWLQILAILEQHGFSGAKRMLQFTDPVEIKERLLEDWADMAEKL